MKRIILGVLCLLLVGCVTAVDESLPYTELPTITVATEVKLVASPSHPSAYLPFDPILAGEKVQVIGADKDVAWLLVSYHNKLGWMPSIFSRDKISTLKIAIVFELTEDNCTEYLNTAVAMDRVWQSNTSGAVVVVGSIYRPQTSKQFDDATLAIQIDGSGAVIDSDYLHTPLTPVSALILFTYSVTDLQKGDQITFKVNNPGDEHLSFQAIFFSNTCAMQDKFTDILPIGKIKVSVPTSELPGTRQAELTQSSHITVVRSSTVETPTPTATVTPTTISTGTISSISSISTISIPPTVSPVDVVEVESPSNLYVAQSDTIRITLKRTHLFSYAPTLEISGNTLITDVILPIGTLQVPLSETYGVGYQLIATAKLIAPDVEIKPVSPESQPYDVETITWLFSISGKKPGKHKLTASLTIRWLPEESTPTKISPKEMVNSVERQVWRGQFDITIKEPILRVGSYTIGEIWTFVGGGGLLGGMLGWFANDIKERLISSNKIKRRRRAKR